MKIVRLSTPDGLSYAKLDADGRFYFIDGDCYDIKSVATEPYNGEIVYAVPVEPTKIVALGANYFKHAKELSLSINSDPTIFLKPTTALIADGEQIVIPRGAHRVDYEAELAVIISKRCKDIAEADAKDYILGYTCANDVSERYFQKLDGQWSRAKGFDTFCPLGKCIATDIDPSDLDIKAVLNGKTVQHSRTSNMIHGVDAAVAFVSSVMTLNKGDVILMGTPENVGEIVEGDQIEIVIEQVGSLSNGVIKA